MAGRSTTTFLAAILALLMVPTMLFGQKYDHGPDLDQSKDYYAVIYTRLGNIYLKLFPDKAPETVRNFVNLAEGTAEFKHPVSGKKVKQPYYNGILFHRVMPDFMIQTGDPTATGSGGPGYKFADEFDPSLTFAQPGKLAMANSGPATNGSQFFITEVPTTWLTGKHTIFGEVIEGTGSLEVVKKIARVETDPANNKPRKELRMERVEIVRMEKGVSAQEALAKLQGQQSPQTTPPADQAQPAEEE